MSVLPVLTTSSWIFNFLTHPLIACLILLYVFCRLTCGISRSSQCLAGKTALVTGGNSGIGYQVCLNLASRGCRVIIADKDDSEQSKQEIIERTGNCNISSRRLDLASFESIRNFVKDLETTEDKLNILINNAGVSWPPPVSTADGFNVTIQVNYLGPFLLTYLLINLLKKGAQLTKCNSRIVFTSSLMAFLGTIKVNDMLGNHHQSNRLGLIRLYANSKLATLMICDIFAEKLINSGITCNSVHPGYVKTNMTSNFNFPNDNPPLIQLLQLAIFLFEYISVKSPWEGSQTTTHVAVSKRLENVTRKYFWDCIPFIKPPQADSVELAKELWELSVKAVKLRPEEQI